MDGDGVGKYSIVKKSVLCQHFELYFVMGKNPGAKYFIKMMASRHEV